VALARTALLGHARADAGNISTDGSVRADWPTPEFVPARYTPLCVLASMSPNRLQIAACPANYHPAANFTFQVRLGAKNCALADFANSMVDRRSEYFFPVKRLCGCNSHPLWSAFRLHHIPLGPQFGCTTWKHVWLSRFRRAHGLHTPSLLAARIEALNIALRGEPATHDAQYLAIREKTIAPIRARGVIPGANNGVSPFHGTTGLFSKVSRPRSNPDRAADPSPAFAGLEADAAVHLSPEGEKALLTALITVPASSRGQLSTRSTGGR